MLYGLHGLYLGIYMYKQIHVCTQYKLVQKEVMNLKVSVESLERGRGRAKCNLTIISKQIVDHSLRCRTTKPEYSQGFMINAQ